MATVREDCSGCAEPFSIDTDTGVLTMEVPSNGRRGGAHVAAHTLTTEAVLDRGETLWLWDCPRCGYADSEYVDDETRSALT